MIRISGEDGRRAILLAALLGTVCPADEVVLKQRDGIGTYAVQGEIADFTGEKLTLRHPSGREEQFPSRRVVDVKTKWSAQHLAGDRFLSAGDFAESVTAYRSAFREEKRAWVRTRLLLQLCWAYQHQGDTLNAAKAFLAMLQLDPTTAGFRAIPLAWTTSEAQTSLQAQLDSWLERDRPPATRLIAASWGLTSQLRAEARQVLLELARHEDARIAFLALAQLQRTELARMGREETVAWKEKVTAIPEALRAGPYFLLGQAWSRNNAPQESAAAFLRTAILHSDHRQLAARSLLAAGRELEKMDQAPLAERLYQELRDDFPETTAAREAPLPDSPP